MASITFSGQLDQAMNEAAAEGNKILFIPQQTVGEVLPGAASELIVESDGSYNITLAYNTYSIYHYSDVTKKKTLIASSVVVSADTAVSTIPDLIGSTVPVTEDSVLTIQGYLTDAQDSATAAATSESNAADSEAYVAGVVDAGHNALTGRDDENSHPASAIQSDSGSNLEDELTVSYSSMGIASGSIEMDIGVGDDYSGGYYTYNGSLMKCDSDLTGEVDSIDEYSIGTSDDGVPELPSTLKSNENKRYQSNIQAQKSTLLGLAQSGGSIVVLGDSTECGVGVGGGPYGQTTEEIFNGPFNRLAFSVIKSDPNFVGVDSSYIGYKTVSESGSLFFPYECAAMTVSDDSAYETNLLSTAKNSRESITVYYYQRTSDNAPTASVTVYNYDTDTVLGSGTLDSYADAITFNEHDAGITSDVAGRLAKFTVDLSSSARRVRVKVDSLGLVDRGNGLATDGTLLLFGFTIGDGIDYNNLAVSSTTLTEGSDANISRGIDTSERVALLKSLDADFVYIGWGTNDSKADVTTKSQFESDYVALIEDLRSWKSTIKICLGTDPKGSDDSIYKYNNVYSNIIRKVAYDNNCMLFDVETLTELSTGDYYSDDVHPNALGDQSIYGSMCSYFGITPLEKSNSRAIENRYGQKVYSYEIDKTQSDFTSTFISIFSESVPKPTYCNSATIIADLNLGRANADLDQCTLYMTVNGVTVAQEVVSQAQVSTNAIANVTLSWIGEFSTFYDEISIEIFAKDFGFRSGSSTSLVKVKFD